MCFMGILEKAQVMPADFKTPAKRKKLTIVVLNLFAKCDKTVKACKHQTPDIFPLVYSFHRVCFFSQLGFLITLNTTF